MSKLYIGNIQWDVTVDQLSDLLETCGTVIENNLLIDRETGRSKGYAFVEMEDADTALRAIERLNGYELNGRPLNVRKFVEESNNRRPNSKNRNGRKPARQERDNRDRGHRENRDRYRG